MEWTKEIGALGGAEGGWRNDFPLSPALPNEVTLDCRRLTLPIHPMFAVRVRVFIEWHRREGRAVNLLAPIDEQTRRVFEALGIEPDLAGDRNDDDSILAVTQLETDIHAEEASRRTREILEYQMTDISLLGEAAFTAVAELCDNALDHGRNPIGAWVAARRITEPRRQVSIAISDLGMGIPEHIRQRYPEWSEDGYAIAQAMEEGITGTGNPHRGIGFSEVFEAALTASLHAAKMEVHSASGLVRLQVVQNTRKLDVIPAARYRRGTWITYDLVSV